jgi:hypothetical protein
LFQIEKNIAAGRPMDKLAMISYLTGVYELFRYADYYREP